MTSYSVSLIGGPPWGFRVSGATNSVSQVIPQSRASKEGVQSGDQLLKINSKSVDGFSESELQRTIKRASGVLKLTFKRSTSSAVGSQQSSRPASILSNDFSTPTAPTSPYQEQRTPVTNGPPAVYPIQNGFIKNHPGDFPQKSWDSESDAPIVCQPVYASTERFSSPARRPTSLGRLQHYASTSTINDRPPTPSSEMYKAQAWTDANNYSAIGGRRWAPVRFAPSIPTPTAQLNISAGPPSTQLNYYPQTGSASRPQSSFDQRSPYSSYLLSPSTSEPLIEHYIPPNTTAKFINKDRTPTERSLSLKPFWQRGIQSLDSTPVEALFEDTYALPHVRDDVIHFRTSGRLGSELSEHASLATESLDLTLDAYSVDEWSEMRLLDSFSAQPAPMDAPFTFNRDSEKRDKQVPGVPVQNGHVHDIRPGKDQQLSATINDHAVPLTDIAPFNTRRDFKTATQELVAELDSLRSEVQRPPFAMGEDPENGSGRSRSKSDDTAGRMTSEVPTVYESALEASLTPDRLTFDPDLTPIPDEPMGPKGDVAISANDTHGVDLVMESAAPTDINKPPPEYPKAFAKADSPSGWNSGSQVTQQSSHFRSVPFAAPATGGSYAGPPPVPPLTFQPYTVDNKLLDTSGFGGMPAYSGNTPTSAAVAPAPSKKAPAPPPPMMHSKAQAPSGPPLGPPPPPPMLPPGSLTKMVGKIPRKLEPESEWIDPAERSTIEYPDKQPVSVLAKEIEKKLSTGNGTGMSTPDNTGYSANQQSIMPAKSPTTPIQFRPAPLIPVQQTAPALPTQPPPMSSFPLFEQERQPLSQLQTDPVPPAKSPYTKPPLSPNLPKPAYQQPPPPPLTGGSYGVGYQPISAPFGNTSGSFGRSDSAPRLQDYQPAAAPFRGPESLGRSDSASRLAELESQTNSLVEATESLHKALTSPAPPPRPPPPENDFDFSLKRPDFGVDYHRQISAPNTGYRQQQQQQQHYRLEARVNSQSDRFRQLPDAYDMHMPQHEFEPAAPAYFEQNRPPAIQQQPHRQLPQTPIQRSNTAQHRDAYEYDRRMPHDMHSEAYYAIPHRDALWDKSSDMRYDGVGPQDSQGMPTGLRQHVEPGDDQHNWYKMMYKRLHKINRPEEVNPFTVAYRNSDYMSEPEIEHRLHNKSYYGTMPRNRREQARDVRSKSAGRYELPSPVPADVIKPTPAGEKYRVQPKRIEDYVPGRSTLADYEANPACALLPSESGQELQNGQRSLRLKQYANDVMSEVNSMGGRVEDQGIRQESRRLVTTIEVGSAATSSDSAGSWQPPVHSSETVMGQSDSELKTSTIKRTPRVTATFVHKPPVPPEEAPPPTRLTGSIAGRSQSFSGVPVVRRPVVTSDSARKMQYVARFAAETSIDADIEPVEPVPPVRFHKEVPTALAPVELLPGSTVMASSDSTGEMLNKEGKVEEITQCYRSADNEVEIVKLSFARRHRVPQNHPQYSSRYYYTVEDQMREQERRELPPPTREEAREWYRTIQHGGEVPYGGLRQPVPSRTDSLIKLATRIARHSSSAGSDLVKPWTRPARSHSPHVLAPRDTSCQTRSSASPLNVGPVDLRYYTDARSTHITRSVNRCCDRGRPRNRIHKPRFRPFSTSLPRPYVRYTDRSPQSHVIPTGRVRDSVDEVERFGGASTGDEHHYTCLQEGLPKPVDINRFCERTEPSPSTSHKYATPHTTPTWIASKADMNVLRGASAFKSPVTTEEPASGLFAVERAKTRDFHLHSYRKRDEGLSPKHTSPYRSVKPFEGPFHDLSKQQAELKEILAKRIEQPSRTYVTALQKLLEGENGYKKQDKATSTRMQNLRNFYDEMYRESRRQEIEFDRLFRSTCRALDSAVLEIEQLASSDSPADRCPPIPAHGFTVSPTNGTLKHFPVSILPVPKRKERNRRPDLRLKQSMYRSSSMPLITVETLKADQYMIERYNGKDQDYMWIKRQFCFPGLLSKYEKLGAHVKTSTLPTKIRRAKAGVKFGKMLRKHNSLPDITEDVTNGKNGYVSTLSPVKRTGSIEKVTATDRTRLPSEPVSPVDVADENGNQQTMFMTTSTDSVESIKKQPGKSVSTGNSPMYRKKLDQCVGTQFSSESSPSQADSQYGYSQIACSCYKCAAMRQRRSYASPDSIDYGHLDEFCSTGRTLVCRMELAKQWRHTTDCLRQTLERQLSQGQLIRSFSAPDLTQPTQCTSTRCKARTKIIQCETQTQTESDSIQDLQDCTDMIERDLSDLYATPLNKAVTFGRRTHRNLDDDSRIPTIPLKRYGPSDVVQCMVLRRAAAESYDYDRNDYHHSMESDPYYPPIPQAPMSDYMSPPGAPHKEQLPMTTPVQSYDFGREETRNVLELERLKKQEREVRDAQARRHAYPPPAAPNVNVITDERFETIESMKNPRPIPASRKMGRVLYNFNAQNPREISVRKGETVEMKKIVDANWIEVDINGLVGLLPSNYIEIAENSISNVAETRPEMTSELVIEGQAHALFNFEARSGNELSLRKGETLMLIKKVDGNWWEGRNASGKRGIFPMNYVKVIQEPHSYSKSTNATPSTSIPPPIGLATVPSSDYTIPKEHSVSVTTSSRRTPSVSRLQVNGIVMDASKTPETYRSSYSQQFSSDQKNLQIQTAGDYDTYQAVYTYVPQHPDELELYEGDVIYVMEKCDDGWYIGTSLRTGKFGTFPGNYVHLF